MKEKKRVNWDGIEAKNAWEMRSGNWSAPRSTRTEQG